MNSLDINLVGNLANITQLVQANESTPDSVGTFDPFSQSSPSLFDGDFHGQSFFSTETNTLVIAFSGTTMRAIRGLCKLSP